MNDTSTTSSSKLTSFLILLVLAVGGSVAFYVVFELMNANGLLSAAIYLVILSICAVVETANKRKGKTG